MLPPSLSGSIIGPRSGAPFHSERPINGRPGPEGVPVTAVSVSMPEDLLERLDAFVADHGDTGRSEVVREAARTLLGEFEDPSLEGRDLLGVVTVRLDYRSIAVEQDLTAPRHEHDGLVASNVHDHVGDRYCMELSILEGSLADIAAFVQAVRATADALSVDDAVGPADQVGTAAEEPG